MTALKSLSEPRRISPRLAGLIAALLMAALLQFIGPERVSRPLFDAWQRLAPRDLSQTDVRIVWIDEISVKRYGAWPWPRHLLAQLAANLANANAKLVGFDIIFPEADPVSPKNFTFIYRSLSPAAAAEIDRLPSTDASFAAMIGQTPVVLGRIGLDAPPLKTPPVLAVEAQFVQPLPASVKSWGRALSNISTIDDVGLGHGLLNGDRDSDAIVRRVPLVGKVAGTDMPGFALELARVATAVDQIVAESDQGQLRAISLTKTRLPVEPDGSMRLHFGNFPTEATIPAIDVLDGSLDPKRVAGKIVLVGISGAGTADIVTTPLAVGGYGTEIQANAVDSILAGATLERPRWAWIVEGLLAVLLVLVAVRLMPRLRPLAAGLVACVTILALLGLSLVAFARAGLLLDVLSPLLTAGATGVTMVIMLFARARRQRAQLTATLQDERVVAARSAGELAAARDIQIGMLPPREGLAAFDPAVALDALIEPARSVGGDFYDAIRIDATRVCFLVGDVTGKGVPAALFMALSKALTKSVLLRDGHDLAAAVTRLNDEIARDNREDMFVTMIFGLLDTASGALALCNAGHENPWLVRANGSVTHLSPDGGPPLSVAPGFPFEVETIQLAAGDAVVFVSDGITEAQSPMHDFFGTERLAAVLVRLASTPEISATSDALLKEVRLFENGAEATDDLTVLAFRYTGNKAT